MNRDPDASTFAFDLGHENCPTLSPMPEDDAAYDRWAGPGPSPLFTEVFWDAIHDEEEHRTYSTGVYMTCEACGLRLVMKLRRGDRP